VNFGRFNTLVLMTAVLSCLAASSGYAQQHEHSDPMPAGAKLGAVSFEISCKAELQPEFNRAVALLHSFWHSEAQRAFERVAAADPNCAMAYWGVAMSHFHLGLSWPAPADLELGRQALRKAEAAAEKDAREAAYIEALRELYTDFKIEDSWKYFKSYADKLSQIAASYPKDLEAKVFEGLALILAEQPGDSNLTELKQAVNLLQPLLLQYPDHPGIAHYLIHACDTPGLAQEGLEAARRYAKIAPAAPHALHMPSHIFTRLGLWQEDIDSNLASRAAAEKAQAGAENRLHAMEFLEYAYLQIGHDEEARAIMAETKTVRPSEVDSRYGNYYATVQARFPTMFAIETRDWQAAAHAELIAGDDGWGRGLTLLAHAIAAGHLRDGALAKTTLQATEVFIKQQMKGRPLPQSGTAEAGFLDEIHAWTDFANGDLAGAVKLLRPIADAQDRVGKGELDLPVREMIAEMLLIDGKDEEALKEYQASLASDPNRFNALLGAGQAAERLGQRDVAAKYYRTLLVNCGGANGSALVAVSHAQMVVDEIGSNARNAAKSIVPRSDEAVISCERAAPGSITAALTCIDKTEAMGRLDEAGCFVANAPAVVEVRNVWLARESLPASAAARDHTIQLFMAACLVEAHSKLKPADAAELSAVAFLRHALADPDPQTAGIAMLSLAPVLVQDDIAIIVERASTESALVMPAVTALSFPCTVEAASGIAKIQSVYAGSERGSEIQRLVEGNAALCDDEGHANRAAFSGEVLVPAPREGEH
jgi:hypothetical protein